MALSAKLTKIYIRQKSNSWKYSFKVKDTLLDIGQVNYGSPYDEAIDGSFRSNMRGFRMIVDLPLNKLYSSLVEQLVGGNTDTFESFLGDLTASMVTNSDGHIQVSFDNTNWHNVIPESSSYKVTYTNQIARASGSMKLIGLNIITSVPASLQAPSV